MSTEVYREREVLQRVTTSMQPMFFKYTLGIIMYFLASTVGTRALVDRGSIQTSLETKLGTDYGAPTTTSVQSLQLLSRLHVYTSDPLPKPDSRRYLLPNPTSTPVASPGGRRHLLAYPTSTPVSVPEWALAHFMDSTEEAKKRPPLDATCNLFTGKWIYDPSAYPLWNPTSEIKKDEKMICTQQDRPDSDYLRLRWQPEGCNIPRFNASSFRQMYRNKRIGFVGDSIGRNQFLSLAGMLSEGATMTLDESPPRGISQRHHYQEENVTLDYFRAPYIVMEARPPTGAPEQVKVVLRVEKLGHWLTPAQGVDLLVFNAGHWFLQGRSIKRGLYPTFENGTIMLEMEEKEVFRLALQTLADWADTKLQEEPNMHIVLRGNAPPHGSSAPCPANHPAWYPDPLEGDWHADTAKEIIGRMERKLIFLDIWEMSLKRNDAHVGSGDCSHWCVPGVPDIWNELMYSMLLLQPRGSIPGEDQKGPSQLEPSLQMGDRIIRKQSHAIEHSLALPAQIREDSNLSATAETGTTAPLISHFHQEHFSDTPEEAAQRLPFSPTCDLFHGKWVYDPENYPLWSTASNDLSVVPDAMRTCYQMGRNDTEFTHYRWQPHGCNLPRFDADRFLESFRNRLIMFVGDSLARNQYYSLLGILLEGRDPSTYTWRPAFPQKRKVTCSVLFKDFGVLIESYRAPHLVRESRPPKEIEGVSSVLHLDQLGPWIYPAKEAALLVVNAGHWFHAGHIQKRGCYPMVGDVVHKDMSLADIYRGAVETWARWAVKMRQKGAIVVMRSNEPAHGKGLRRCPVDQPTWSPDPIPPDNLAEMAKEIIASVMGSDKADFLDIWEMSSMRNDAHRNYVNNDPRPDCSHWCFPGVPDIWNELMFALLLQRDRLPLAPNAPSFNISRLHEQPQGQLKRERKVARGRR
eukprot:TRINITY_DN26282_c0_g1_i1.p1 TRINITY_DN26282_c0_g1~~TRINITY_DN26282_c0_g1_i1.p1  ORF type:complete len:916 (+),score=26.48 TRINITY_DN26282_c0_g1_i1:202-2949(+)